MPDNAEPRLAQLTEETMSARQKEVAARITNFTVHGIGGPFNVMLRSPEAAAAMMDLGHYLRFDTGIDDRLVEIAILIHARAWTDQYEWARHIDRARDAGVSEAIIDDLRQGKRPSAMADDEAVVFDYCVESEVNHRVGDDTYGRALAMFGEKGVVDFAILIGNYHIVSLLLALNNIGLPDGGDALPEMAAPFAA
jgi:4-carboxymuconolactone decarboxylase